MNKVHFILAGAESNRKLSRDVRKQSTSTRRLSSMFEQRREDPGTSQVLAAVVGRSRSPSPRTADEEDDVLP